MKFSVVTALSAILGTAAAASNQAIVVNECSKPIYVQSFPYDGSKPGALTTVQPGKKFSENMRSSGSTVKIATTRTLTKPLFFGYSSSSDPDYAYYEFSTRYGNPFSNQHNTLSAGDGCMEFNCKPNDPNCYSTPSKSKVYGCPKPVNVVATICA